MYNCFKIALALLISTSAAQAEMTVSFKWGDIPLCTSGSPNIVSNPEFKLSGVPEGTTKIIFKLKDVDVPNYNHGGGSVKTGTSGVIKTGAFKYKSPCPPNGKHTYEWTAIAKAGSKTLAKAKVQRKYPE